MNSVHLQRGNVLKSKGRVTSSLFHAEKLPETERTRLNQNIAQAIVKKYIGDSEHANS